MTTLISLLLGIAGTCFLVSAFYQRVIRPVLGDLVRFDIFALRDELRKSAIDSAEVKQSFAYQYLERRLCSLIHATTWLSLSGFIEFLLKEHQTKPSAQYERFLREAKPELIEIERKALNLALVVMCINSPIWSCFGSILALGGKVFGWASRKWIELKARSLLERKDLMQGATATA